MKQFDFETELQVRDYECDIQGIVNNAVYLNYLEHCRHKFLQSFGIAFDRLHNEGVDAVVIRAELEYKSSLRPGEEFLVRLKINRQGRLRVVFDQQVIRKNDDKLIVDAKITTVLTRNGKPIAPDMLLDVVKQSGIDIPEF